MSAEIKSELAPLLARRKAATIGRYYHELTAQHAEQLTAFLARHGVALGGVQPHKVPYHVLIVASPGELSFEFQYLLDLDYESVRSLRQGDRGLRKRSHAGEAEGAGALRPAPHRRRRDRAEHLVIAPAAPAGRRRGRPIAKRLGVGQRLFTGGEATRAALLELLGGGAHQPALLFTAGHGLEFPHGDPDQIDRQGALLTQEWTGLGTIAPEHAVGAADIPGLPNPGGLVAFFFACYGAGTPQRTNFAFSGIGNMIAPAPFIAKLLQALLGHANAPALGVVGHVDRAWGFSIQPEGLACGAQPVPWGSPADSRSPCGARP